MTPAELLQRALDAVDGDQFELARQLGVENVTTMATYLQRWGRQGKAPDFQHTIRLLRIAGMLCENGKR